jgi:hypothetical protein
MSSKPRVPFFLCDKFIPQLNPFHPMIGGSGSNMILLDCSVEYRGR